MLCSRQAKRLDVAIGEVLVYESLLTESEAISRLGLSRATLNRLQKTEKELRPVYPSVGTKRYLASQVQAYIERISNRGY
jgi:predicted DNA-binding transcriptional regulator AlpA